MKAMPWKSPIRLNLAKDGITVVHPHDPRSATLLVPAGGELSDADARKYGLIDGSGMPSSGEALTLEPSPALIPTTGVPLPLGEAADHGYAQQLNFGGQQNQQPPAPPQQQEPQSTTAPAPPWQGAPTTAPTQPQTPPVIHPPHDKMTPLPATFPHREILIGLGIDTREKLAAINRDELVSKDGIGSATADEIIDARETLPLS